MEDEGVVCLLGNGASVACAPRLALGPLTASLRTRHNFDALLAVHAGAALASNSHEDFERIVGPWQRLSSMLALQDEGVAEALGVLGFPDELKTPLADIAAWMRSKYQEGVAAVLQEVAGDGEDPTPDPLVRLVDQLLDLAGGDPLSFFTLNYDSLLERTLLDIDARDGSSRWCDIFDGTAEGVVRVDVRGAPVAASRLRPPFPSFAPDRTVHVAHLHGSVQWLQTDGEVFKIRLDDVRSRGVWAAGLGPSDYLPVAILGDAKARDLAREPFASLYSEFERRVLSARLVVIVGYGWRDAHINRVLQRVRSGEGARPQSMFVLDKEPAPGFVWNKLNDAIPIGESLSPPATVFCTGRGLEGAWPEVLCQLLEESPRT